MTGQPRRTRSLALAAARQAPIVLAAVIAVGFGYLAALLVSGRTVATFDIAAAGAAALATGTAMLSVIARMATAGDRAVTDALQRRATTGTHRLPAVDRPDHIPADEVARRDAQHRVDRAQPARHTQQPRP